LNPVIGDVSIAALERPEVVGKSREEPLAVVRSTTAGRHRADVEVGEVSCTS